MTDDRSEADLGLAEDDARWLRTVGHRHRLVGVPTAAQARDRVRAFRLLHDAAPDLADRVRAAMLGPVWWSDIDIVADGDRAAGSPEHPVPDEVGDRLVLRDLRGLFTRLGSRVETGEYAVVDPIDGRIVGRIDLVGGDVGGPVERVARRVRRRRRPDVRDVLELRALDANGMRDHRDPALSEVARLEQQLSEGCPTATTTLASYAWRGPASRARRAMWAAVRTRRSARAWMRRPYVVALSGVDGSGKSTTSRLLVEYLDRVGVEGARVWSRPGNRMEWAERLLSWTGLRDRSAKPTVATVAEGGGDDGAASRRGIVGWVWVLLVTATFLIDVWTQFLRRRRARVIVFDRHLVDARVTLDFVYAGVDLTLARRLCRLLPRADVTFYLAIDPERAAARKPGDTFGLYAVSKQLEMYGSELERLPHVVSVESGGTPERQALTLFDHLAGSPGGPG